MDCGVDVELIRRFLTGDERAYDQLVLRHHPFVVRLARRYVGDVSAAEDVAQEVFLRLYHNAAQFRVPKSFRGWLATIASRLALNELRTRRRKRWVPRSTLKRDELQDEWTPGTTESENPSEELLRQERIEAVRDALAKLPHRQRVALTLQRFESWGLEEIGATLELSVPAVKSLLHRGRVKLGELLADFVETGNRAVGGLQGPTTAIGQENPIPSGRKP